MRGLAALGVLLLLAGCVAPPAAPPSSPEDFGDGTSGSVVPVLPPGCDEEDRGTVLTSKPQAPLVGRFEVCDPRAFFGAGSEVVFGLRGSSGMTGGLVEAGVLLPTGVDLVAGNLSFRGPLPPEGVRLVATLRAASPGDHVLRAWAEPVAWNRNGSRSTAGEVLGIRGSAEQAEVYEVQCTGRSPPPLAVCRQPQVTLVLQATSSNPSRLAAAIVSDTAMPVRAMFWTGAQLVEGWREHDLDLRPGEPVTLNATVVLPEEWVRGGYGGTYQAVLWAYPHASLSARVFEHYVHYVVEDGRVVARDGPGPT